MMTDKKETKPNKSEDKKKVEPTEVENEELITKCEELENKYKRALADYVNLQRRSEEEKDRFIKFANEVLIKQILEILDDLEQSQKHIADTGLDKVVEKFKKFLVNQGVEEVESEGKDFDPTLHEAIESIEGEEGKVLKVHRKGYKFFSKPLRTAIVAVGSGKKG